MGGGGEGSYYVRILHHSLTYYDLTLTPTLMYLLTCTHTYLDPHYHMHTCITSPSHSYSPPHPHTVTDLLTRHLRTSSHSCTSSCTLTLTHPCMYVLTLTHSHPCMPSHTHPYMSSPSHTYTLIYVLTPSSTHVCPHSATCMYLLTLIYNS